MKTNIKIREDLLKDLESRYHLAYEMNQRYVSELLRAVRLTAPNTDGFNVLYSYNDTGRNENAFISNPTPKWAALSRANRLHSQIFPANKKFGTVYSISEDGSKKYEEEITDKIFNVIKSSNLQTMANPYLADLNIGCACFWIDSIEKGNVVFRTIPGITIMPEYCEDPTLKNIWFKRAISKEELKKIAPALVEKTSENNEHYLTCGYIDMRQEKSIQGYLYIQFYDDDFSEPISTEVSTVKKIVLGNATLRPGEARGHGITMQILEEIEFLNGITASIKAYIQYAAEPALTAPDTLIPYMHELRGGVFPSEMLNDGVSPVVPIIWPLNIREVREIIRDSEQKIERFYNIVPLGLPEQTPVVTATEQNLRHSDGERQSVADISMMATDALEGIIKTVMSYLEEWKEIELNKDVKYVIELDTPATNIQSEENINAMIQFSEVSTQVNGEASGPIYINPIRSNKYLRDQLKIPKEILNTPSETKTVIQSIKQQQQQQQQSGAQPQIKPADAVNPSQLGQESSISGTGF